MSELKKAKQRLIAKGSEFETKGKQGELDFSEKSFRRMPHTQSIPKMERERGYTMQERYSQMEEMDPNEMEDDFSLYAPQFSRTGRPAVRNNDDDMFGNRSERIFLFPKEGTTRQRRGTQYTNVREEKQKNLRENEYPEKQKSIYNESPPKMVKNTVHPESLSLVISNPPVRRAYSPNKPKQCDRELVEASIKEQKSNSSNFTDVMFPPKMSIIFNKKYMYLEEGLKFERITKIYESSKLRLVKFCEPTFIIAGKFTSPAMYSALAILAEDPTRVFNLLGTQQLNQQGIYYVNICKDGIWRYIVVDDYMPVKILLRRSLLFVNTIAKDSTHEFWAAILEKALAKVYGTYQDLFLTAGRGVAPILKSLTGYPVSTYAINKDFRAFLVLIDAAIKKKQIVVLEGIEEQNRETGHLKRLQIFQSYQIIEVKKSYVVIRNLAEKQLCTKLTFEEVMIFDRLLIFRYEPNYVYASYKLRHKKKYYAMLKVTVPQRIKCYWEVWQQNQAYYKNHIGSQIQYVTSPYQIVLKAESNQEQTYDSMGEDIIISESGKEVEMRKGTYWVYAHLCQDKELDFVVSFYGEVEVKMERVKNMEQWQLSCSC